VIEFEEGYQVAYDLAEVARHAEVAAAADPGAAVELAADGSVLRFSAGPPVLLLAHGQQEPPAGEVVWLRRKPLAFAERRDDVSDLDFMRGGLADGSVWLRFMYCPRRASNTTVSISNG
jgi:hypothetical protein